MVSYNLIYRKCHLIRNTCKGILGRICCTAIFYIFNSLIIIDIYIFQVPSSHISGGGFLQSPSVLDIDQREMFCVYLFPGSRQSRKVNILLYNLLLLPYMHFHIFIVYVCHLNQFDRSSERK